jgi:pimeloyl-ACP methyl ester carboxylesterase
MSAATDYRFTGADGLQLYSRIYAGPAPQAPTVLCLHGLMHNGADFEELAPQLAVQHRVIVPDPPTTRSRPTSRTSRRCSRGWRCRAWRSSAPRWAD